jgi:hypothetical protein
MALTKNEGEPAVGLLLTLADGVLTCWWLRPRIVTPAGRMAQRACWPSSTGAVQGPARVRLSFLAGLPAQDIS